MTPAGATTQAENTNIAVTAEDITSDTVDIALVPCENVTRDGDVISFADANNDDQADLGSATEAHISAVNGVLTTGSPDYVNNADSSDGDVDVQVQSDGEGCVVVVFFNDADNDNQLDVDENNQPTEEFAVSGNLTFATARAVNATPENAVNRFGTEHTVTAQLTSNTNEASPTAAPIEGETIRFQVFRPSTSTTGAYPDETCTGGTVVQTGSATTDENGTATFTYTGPADPDANSNTDSINDCVLVWHDVNNNGVLDAAPDEKSDAVLKEWSEVATPTTLDLEPEQDVNLVSTNHTATATVANRFDEPVENAGVRFQVWRDVNNDDVYQQVVNTTRQTGPNGQASISYTGPAVTAEDVIVSCTDGVATAPADCEPLSTATAAPETGFTLDRAACETAVDCDTADKYWATTQTANATVTGDIVGFDTDADYVDIQQASGAVVRVAYDTGDQFFVGCGAPDDGTVDTTATAGNAASLTQFESALTLAEDIAADFVSGGTSQFREDDTNNSSTKC